jgi:predicted amidohydrolase
MKPIRLLCFQMPVAAGNVAKNLNYVNQKLNRLKANQVDFIALPEMWTTDYLEENTTGLAQETRQALAQLAQQSQRLDAYILGSCLEEDPDQSGSFFNSVHFIAPGDISSPKWSALIKFHEFSGHYRKIHLFRPLSEHKQFAFGDRPCVLKNTKPPLGLAICYDLRFPEQFRHLAHSGAEIIFLPSAWPKERLGHWRTLLQARAIENQVYMIGINRTGESRRGFDFAGHSMVVGPWGDILWEAGEEETPGMKNLAREVISLDPSEVAKVRKKLPVHADKQPVLYSQWYQEMAKGDLG